MLFLFGIIAGLVQGLCGFGAGIILMMILPNLVSMQTAATIAGMIGLVLCSLIVYSNYKLIVWKDVLIPSIFYMVITSIVITYSKNIESSMILPFFGLFLCILAIYYLFLNKGTIYCLNLLQKSLCIGISALCDGFFGIGGPLMVIYYLSQIKDQKKYLGTIQAFFLINSLYNTIIRIYNGMFMFNNISLFLLGGIGIVLGGLLANRLSNHINQIYVRKFTYICILLAGMYYVFK